MGLKPIDLSPERTTPATFLHDLLNPMRPPKRSRSEFLDHLRSCEFRTSLQYPADPDSGRCSTIDTPTQSSMHGTAIGGSYATGLQKLISIVFSDRVAQRRCRSYLLCSVFRMYLPYRTHPGLHHLLRDIALRMIDPEPPAHSN
jgi:hypothetical protein